MQTFGTAFDQVLNSTAKDPRYAIKIFFDEAGTNYHWVTSHPGTLLPAAETEYTHDVLKGVSGSSQQIFPEEGRATIGAISFKVRDVDMGSIIRTNLDAGRGLNDQKVEVYLGDETLTAWSEYELFQTQIIKGISEAGNWYTFKCADIQRTSKKKIFEVKKTTVNATVTDDATTIGVADTSAFEMVAHGTSYSDAPSATVGYIRIEDEVIRYTGATATTFTGCTRGVLNTKAARHELRDGADADRQLEVDEFVYLEMPAPKLAYAILTGILYGQGGATLPDHWHLDVSTTFVQTTAFTGIGADWWDTSDDSAGVIFRFEGLDSEDGKKFIEKEINYVLGAFSPILSDGSYSYQRQTGVLSSSGYVKTLDDTNLTHAGVLTNDFTQIANLYQVDWNYDFIAEDFTRSNELIDATSISTHGVGDKKTISARGLHGSRFTAALIGQRFDALRDRYSGPPLKVQVKGNLTNAGLEVGDIIRLDLDQLRDYTGEVSSIDRSMEVQRISVDWARGAVTLDLFGSSQKSTTIVHETVSEALLDAYYTGSGGTEINTTNFPTGYTPGAVAHFDGANTLTGGATLDAGRHWHSGDLQFDSAVTITVTDNVLLAVMGFTQINGAIDGKGQGHSGAAGSSAVAGAAGIDGYIGNTRGVGGVTSNFSNDTNSGTVVCAESVTANGDYSSVPVLDLIVDGANLNGLPSSVIGTSGGAGGASSSTVTGDFACSQVINGASGGASGAGLVIVSRGVSFGANGSIDLSGDNGVAGSGTANSCGESSYAGGGSGGSSGACLIVLDGSAVVSPSESKITTDSGAAGSTSGDRYSRPTGVLPQHGLTLEYSYYLGLNPLSGNAYVKTFRLIQEQSPVEDITPEADAVTVIDLAEFTNTPKSVKANLSTVEITVTAPSDPNYLYSFIYYRVTGTDQWTKIDQPAATETSVVLSSDGTEYDFKAHSVSTTGVESPTSISDTITLTNIIEPVAADPEPSTIILIPNVSGLEIFEQGNDFEFTGKDCKFAWRKTSISEFIDIGDSDHSGLSGSLDQYFKDWEVTVYDSSLNVLRIEHVTDNWYLYTSEKNHEDYKRISGADGANRSFTVTVTVRVQFSEKVSPQPAKLSVSNPAPAVPTFTITGGYKSVSVVAIKPADLDFKGIKFSLDGTWYDMGDSPDATISGLASGTAYDVVYGAYDEFSETPTNTAATTVTTQSTFDAADMPIDVHYIGVEATGITLDGTEAPATFDGLYLGDEKMGYVDGDPEVAASWKTYTDSAGNFYLGGTAGSLQWLAASGSLILGDTSTLTLNALTGAFSINDATFGNEGVQIQYNSGTPRMYVGDGADKSFEFDGTDLILGRDTNIRGVASYNTDKYIFSTYFDGNFLAQSVSANALTANGSGGLQLSTTATGVNENATVWVQAADRLRNGTTPTITSDLRFKLGFRHTGNDANTTKKFGFGAMTTGTSGIVGTLAGSAIIGFKIVNNVLYAWGYAGTTEYTASTGVSVIGELQYVEAEFINSTEVLTITVSGGSSTTVTLTGIGSGSPTIYHYAASLVQGSGAAVTSRFILQDYIVIKE